MNDIILTQVPISELVNLIASEVEARIHRPEPFVAPPDRIGLKEAMEITGLRQSSIYKMTMDRKIPHQKFRKRLIFSRLELQVWMEEKTICRQSPEVVAIQQLAKVAKRRVK